MTIRAENIPDPSLVVNPLECRFSFDPIISSSSVILSSIANIENSTHITCLTPDVSAYFDEVNEIYKDAFVVLNDLDGVFRDD